MFDFGSILDSLLAWLTDITGGGWLDWIGGLFGGLCA